MKDGEVSFKQYLVRNGMKVVKFSEDDRNKWKNSPAVKQITKDWVEQREARAFPESACSPCTKLIELLRLLQRRLGSWITAYSIIWTAAICR